MVLSARELAERRSRAERPAAPSAPEPEQGQAAGARRDDKVPEGPEAVFEHPDSTEASPIDAAFTADLGGRRVRVSIERGRVETRDPELAAYLARLGYRKMNTGLEVQEDPAWAAAKARLRE